jgi:hypothetical protein
MPLFSSNHAAVLASLLLGLTSVLMSFWMLGYFGIVFTHFLTADVDTPGGRSWRDFVFEVTRSGPLAVMVGWLGLAAASGGFGYWLVRRTRLDDRASLSASAIRLSMCGLLGVVLGSMLLVGMLGYRVYRML